MTRRGAQSATRGAGGGTDRRGATSAVAQRFPGGLEVVIMDALKNVARAARLLSLVIFDVVRPSRPEYRLPARWLG